MRIGIIQTCYLVNDVQITLWVRRNDELLNKVKQLLYALWKY